MLFSEELLEEHTKTGQPSSCRVKPSCLQRKAVSYTKLYSIEQGYLFNANPSVVWLPAIQPISHSNPEDIGKDMIVFPPHGFQVIYYRYAEMEPSQFWNEVNSAAILTALTPAKG